MPRFAANLTWMFHEFDFPARFEAARELGFEGVECQFPYEFRCGESTAAGLTWARQFGIGA